MGDASVGVVIPAAGTGSRMGGARKPFLDLLGRPLLLWTLDPFLAHPRVGSVVVVLAPDDASAPPAWLAGLDPDVSVVLVHDGARPLVQMEWINACIDCVEQGEGAVVGYPAVDSMKRSDPHGYIAHTESRAGLWQVQTPQGFPRAVLEEAYRLAAESGETGTDDAQLVERVGCPIRLVPGGTGNLKITYPEDVVFAEAALSRRGGPRTPRSAAAPSQDAS